MGKEKVHEYSNGKITIVWKSGRCIHAAKCVGTLPQVYKPGERPWIQMKNASTEDLIAQIKTCPSKALSYKMNNDF